MYGSVRHEGTALLFRIRDPKLHVSVPVRYTGIVPDPFARRAGGDGHRPEAVCELDVPRASQLLTTKCPSKYQAQAGT